MKILLLAISFFFSFNSNACTLCNSKTAAATRALIFDSNFYTNLFYTFLPFIAFAGIIVFIYKSGKTATYQ